MAQASEYGKPQRTDPDTAVPADALTDKVYRYDSKGNPIHFERVARIVVPPSNPVPIAAAAAEES